jgi:hypothetical protein
MALGRFKIAFAAASLVVAAPGFGGDLEPGVPTRVSQPACTPEAQRCREALKTKLLVRGHIDDWVRIGGAYRILEDSDPECALLLRERNLKGL